VRAVGDAFLGHDQAAGVDDGKRDRPELFGGGTGGPLQAVVLAVIKTTAIERGFVGAQIGLADAWYLAGWTSKPDQLGGVLARSLYWQRLFSGEDFWGSCIRKG